VVRMTDLSCAGPWAGSLGVAGGPVAGSRERPRFGRLGASTGKEGPAGYCPAITPSSKI
jgi:hypothetical protein